MDSAVTTRLAVDVQSAARIGKRLAKGLNLEQACILEEPPITVEDYNVSIKARPELKLYEKRATAMYIVERLADIERGVECTGSKWILEKAHRHQYGDHRTATTVHNTFIAGVPEDMLKKMRDSARKNSRTIDVEVMPPPVTPAT